MAGDSNTLQNDKGVAREEHSSQAVQVSASKGKKKKGAKDDTNGETHSADSAFSHLPEDQMKSLAIQRKAFIGYAWLDLAKGIGATMKPSSFNPRPLEESKAVKLLEAFNKEGLQKVDYPILVAVPRRVVVETSCVDECKEIATVPTLELNEERADEMVVLAGQHRRRALELYREAVQSQIDNEERTVKRLRQHERKAGHAEMIESGEQKLEDLQAKLTWGRSWLVRVYDLDVLTADADGRMLGSQLASNRPSFQFHATEHEISRTICALLDERGLKWTDKAKNIRRYEGGTSHLETMLRDQDTTMVWRELQKYPGLANCEWAKYRKWGKNMGTHWGGMIALVCKVYLGYLRTVTTVDGVHEPELYTEELGNHVDREFTRVGLDNLRTFTQPSSSEVYKRAVLAYWEGLSGYEFLRGYEHRSRPMISGKFIKLAAKMWQDCNLALGEMGAWIEPFIVIYGPGSGHVNKTSHMGGGGHILFEDLTIRMTLTEPPGVALERFHDLYQGAIKPFAESLGQYEDRYPTKVKHDCRKHLPGDHTVFNSLKSKKNHQWVKEWVGNTAKNKAVEQPPIVRYACNLLEGSRANFALVALGQKNNARVAEFLEWAIQLRYVMADYLRTQMAGIPKLGELRQYMQDVWRRSRWLLDGEFRDGAGVESGGRVPQQAVGSTWTKIPPAVTLPHYEEQSRHFIRAYQTMEKVPGFRRPCLDNLSETVPCPDVQDALVTVGKLMRRNLAELVRARDLEGIYGKGKANSEEFHRGDIHKDVPDTGISARNVLFPGFINDDSVEEGDSEDGELEESEGKMTEDECWTEKKGWSRKQTAGQKGKVKGKGGGAKVWRGRKKTRSKGDSEQDSEEGEEEGRQQPEAVIEAQAGTQAGQEQRAVTEIDPQTAPARTARIGWDRARTELPVQQTEGEARDGEATVLNRPEVQSQAGQEQEQRAVTETDPQTPPARTARIGWDRPGTESIRVQQTEGEGWDGEATVLNRPEVESSSSVDPGALPIRPDDGSADIRMTDGDAPVTVAGTSQGRKRRHEECGDGEVWEGRRSKSPPKATVATRCQDGDSDRQQAPLKGRRAAAARGRRGKAMTRRQGVSPGAEETRGQAEGEANAVGRGGQEKDKGGVVGEGKRGRGNDRTGCAVQEDIDMWWSGKSFGGNRGAEDDRDSAWWGDDCEMSDGARNWTEGGNDGQYEGDGAGVSRCTVDGNDGDSGSWGDECDMLDDGQYEGDGADVSGYTVDGYDGDSAWWGNDSDMLDDGQYEGDGAGVSGCTVDGNDGDSGSWGDDSDMLDGVRNCTEVGNDGQYDGDSAGVSAGTVDASGFDLPGSSHGLVSQRLSPVASGDGNVEQETGCDSSTPSLRVKSTSGRKRRKRVATGAEFEKYLASGRPRKDSSELMVITDSDEDASKLYSKVEVTSLNLNGPVVFPSSRQFFDSHRFKSLAPSSDGISPVSFTSNKQAAVSRRASSSKGVEQGRSAVGTAKGGNDKNRVPIGRATGAVQKVKPARPMKRAGESEMCYRERVDLAQNKAGTGEVWVWPRPDMYRNESGISRLRGRSEI